MSVAWSDQKNKGAGLPSLASSSSSSTATSVPVTWYVGQSLGCVAWWHCSALPVDDRKSIAVRAVTNLFTNHRLCPSAGRSAGVGFGRGWCGGWVWVLPAHWGEPLSNDFVTRLTSLTGRRRRARSARLRSKLNDIQSRQHAAAAAAAASDRLRAALSINNVQMLSSRCQKALVYPGMYPRTLDNMSEVKVKVKIKYPRSQVHCILTAHVCVIPGAMSSPGLLASYRESKSGFSRHPHWQNQPAGLPFCAAGDPGVLQRFILY